MIWLGWFLIALGFAPIVEFFVLGILEEWFEIPEWLVVQWGISLGLGLIPFAFGFLILVENA